MGPEHESLAELLGRADVLCAASTGVAPSVQTVLKAIASGAVPVAARIPVYEEILDDGEEGLLFEPGDVATLAGQLTRLASEPQLREAFRERCLARRPSLDWKLAAERVEVIYGRLAARRHSPPAAAAGIRRRLSARLHLL